jgi:hypothetical protein
MVSSQFDGLQLQHVSPLHHQGLYGVPFDLCQRACQHALLTFCTNLSNKYVAQTENTDIITSLESNVGLFIKQK